MKRVRAEALVLVNWRGVFYEYYALDPHVTALEGVNGSGKTTVLIAAYLVLMPDQTKLRFTNLGETAATGGDRGIYGRLGEEDAPSYAVLDLRLGRGKRLLAGVHIQRAAEPSLVIRPFIISDLADDVSPQDVLLANVGDHHQIPDLNGLRELVALQGASLKTFDSPRDYLAALFERDVTPMRLSTDEERTKFNDMLRTSMVGGISEALGRGLRDFLLREDNTLGETVRRMQGNLDACRRTRRLVNDTFELERDIEGVYSAATSMYVAAIQATGAREREGRERLEAARGAHAAASHELAEQERARKAAGEKREAANRRLDDARAALESARAELQITRQANEILHRVETLEARHAQKVAECSEARTAAALSAERRQAAEARAERAMRDYRAAVDGLADLDSGLDELERRAWLHERVTTLLGHLAPQQVTPAREAASRECTRQDGIITTCDREIAGAEARRAEFGQVVAALDTLGALGALGALDTLGALGALGALDTLGALGALGANRSGMSAAEEAGRREGAPSESALPASPYEVARAVLAALREDDALAASIPRLEGELRDARQHAADQAEVGKVLKAWASRETSPTSDARPQESPRTMQPPVEVPRTAEQLRALFRRTDVALATARQERADLASVATAERLRLQHAAGRVRDLEAEAQAREKAQAALDTLTSRHERPLENRVQLAALEEHLLAARVACEREIREKEARREDVRQRVRHMEDSGGTLPPSLVQAAEAVGGDLLASRFEDVALEDAARVQALLGPMAEALVVDDVAGAARLLAARADRPDTVWLVGRHGSFRIDDLEGDRVGDSVLVGNTRLTRLPDAPVIGRRARTLRIKALHAEVDALSDDLVRLPATLRACRADSDEATGARAHFDLLERPDPVPELALARTEEARARDAEAQASARLDVLTTEVPRLEDQRTALAAILPLAHVLDLPDAAAAAGHLQGRLTGARVAAERVREGKKARETVEAGLDVLRRPPPDDHALEGLRTQQKQAERERDAAATRLRDLRFCEENLVALQWADAHEALAARKALAPTLRTQVEEAQAEETRASEAAVAAQHGDLACQRALSQIDGERAALHETLAQEHRALSATGCTEASDAAVEACRTAVERANEREQQRAGEERTLAEEVIRCDERVQGRLRTVEARRIEQDDAEREWRPTLERRQRLEQRLAEAGLPVPEEVAGKSAISLWGDARSWRTSLIDRLEHGRDGGPTAQSLRARFEAASEEVGEVYLDAWGEVHEWLRRRVPATVSEHDDPVAALAQVRDHLASLRDKLADQEKRLRGDSSDIARSIATSRARARRSVTTLNRDLARVSFGNIRSLRIQVEGKPHMEQLLARLQADTGQGSLFDGDVPIEEVMADLFKQLGGGRDRGHRLLDYREYMKLCIEVQRQGRAEWEEANPIHLSTGEAMGVGAAVMMVVLAAWERDASMLRRSSETGTLRLLFLDEANRLSHDNLAVLFELCRNLELQLLIAAPEVAHGEGATTYHLVRQVGADGREEVVKSGRRYARADAPPLPARRGLRRAAGARGDDAAGGPRGDDAAGSRSTSGGAAGSRSTSGGATGSGGASRGEAGVNGPDAAIANDGGVTYDDLIEADLRRLAEAPPSAFDAEGWDVD